MFALVIAVFPAAAKDEGFEGKWVLDKKKTTDLTGVPNPMETRIKRDGEQIVVQSKYNEPTSGIYPLSWLGIMAFEMKLNADGSDSTNLLGPFKHQSKTTIEGNRMVTSFVGANEAGEAVNGEWIRTLSDDGREMTCQIKTKTADGRVLDKTLIFKRK